MSVTITAVGDLCAGDHYFSLGHGTGSRLREGHDPFSEIRSLLAAGDVCVANLECPLSDVTSQFDEVERDVFRGPPSAAKLIRKAGIEILNLANNHILQHGENAFRETIRCIRDEGLVPLGLVEAQESCPVIIRREATTLGFLGFSFVPERYSCYQHQYASFAEPAALTQISKLKERVDHVIVSVHWGKECTAIPAPEVVSFAHRVVGAGASVVLGHHPHWFQPVERVDGALIAYSLGDFLFDLFWDRRSIETAVLSVTLGPNGVIDYHLTPLKLDTDLVIRPQSIGASRAFLAELHHNQDQMAESELGMVSGAVARWERLRKLAYFLRNARRGNSRLKSKFVLSKLARLNQKAFDGTLASKPRGLR